MLYGTKVNTGLVCLNLRESSRKRLRRPGSDRQTIATYRQTYADIRCVLEQLLEVAAICRRKADISFIAFQGFSKITLTSSRMISFRFVALSSSCGNQQ